MQQFNPVLLATPQNIARWVDVAKRQPVSSADADSMDGRRLYFEILFGRSFLALDRSFHASLRDYLARVKRRDFGTHQIASVSAFLELVEPSVSDMHAAGFIDDELAALASDPAVGEFITRYRRA